MALLRGEGPEWGQKIHQAVASIAAEVLERSICNVVIQRVNSRRGVRHGGPMWKGR
jgi:hypothetical protein